MSLKCVCVGFYKEATPITIHNRDKKNNILKADVDKVYHFLLIDSLKN